MNPNFNPNDPNANNPANFNAPPMQANVYQTFVPPAPSFYPSMQPMFPPMTGMPMMPMMAQASYPTGQGPLADQPGTVGDNGLLVAPEPEGPEQHEGQQYMKLNPVEVAQYFEYWNEASEGAESVSGKQAVEFLGRASKVSKGQLRRIWDISDHLNDGALDESQFFIALRFVALAQRGAELSTSGLRNFSGIQLIPKIDKPVPKPKTPPPPPAQVGDGGGFSWILPKQAAEKFDEFFKGLMPNEVGLLDAGRVVPFLTKSGLPRQTLKKVWQLADVTRDGLLSSDEFRTAMHVVTALRNNRISVDQLPDSLDPSGPNWLRVEGEEQLQIQTQQQQFTENNTAIDVPPNMSSAPPPPPPPFAEGTISSDSLIPPPPLSGPPSSSEGRGSVSELDAERAERQKMLELMRNEREEMERTRKEMEAMRTEMEKLKMEKATLATTTSTAKNSGVKPIEKTEVTPMPVPFAPAHVGGLSVMPIASTSIDNLVTPDTEKKKPIIKDDDEEEDEEEEEDDDDDDDDDDDFWGGLGPKPTLGGSGNSNNNDSNNNSNAPTKGFGGTELDDWVF